MQRQTMACVSAGGDDGPDFTLVLLVGLIILVALQKGL